MPGPIDDISTFVDTTTGIPFNGDYDVCSLGIQTLLLAAEYDFDGSGSNDIYLREISYAGDVITLGATLRVPANMHGETVLCYPLPGVLGKAVVAFEELSAIFGHRNIKAFIVERSGGSLIAHAITTIVADDTGVTFSGWGTRNLLCLGPSSFVLVHNEGMVKCSIDGSNNVVIDYVDTTLAAMTNLVSSRGPYLASDRFLCDNNSGTVYFIHAGASAFTYGTAVMSHAGEGFAYLDGEIGLGLVSHHWYFNQDASLPQTFTKIECNGNLMTVTIQETVSSEDVSVGRGAYSGLKSGTLSEKWMWVPWSKVDIRHSESLVRIASVPTGLSFVRSVLVNGNDLVWAGWASGYGIIITLYRAELVACIETDVLSDDPAALWLFSEGSGYTTEDATSMGHTLTQRRWLGLQAKKTNHEWGTPLGGGAGPQHFQGFIQVPGAALAGDTIYVPMILLASSRYGSAASPSTPTTPSGWTLASNVAISRVNSYTGLGTFTDYYRLLVFTRIAAPADIGVGWLVDAFGTDDMQWDTLFVRTSQGVIAHDFTFEMGTDDGTPAHTAIGHPTLGLSAEHAIAAVPVDIALASASSTKYTPSTPYNFLFTSSDDRPLSIFTLGTGEAVPTEIGEFVQYHPLDNRPFAVFTISLGGELAASGEQLADEDNEYGQTPAPICDSGCTDTNHYLHFPTLHIDPTYAFSEHAAAPLFEKVDGRIFKTPYSGSWTVETVARDTVFIRIEGMSVPITGRGISESLIELTGTDIEYGFGTGAGTSHPISADHCWRHIVVSYRSPADGGGAQGSYRLWVNGVGPEVYTPSSGTVYPKQGWITIGGNEGAIALLAIYKSLVLEDHLDRLASHFSHLCNLCVNLAELVWGWS